jgi:hypothetical protein
MGDHRFISYSHRDGEWAHDWLLPCVRDVAVTDSIYIEVEVARCKCSLAMPQRIPNSPTV